MGTSVDVAGGTITVNGTGTGTTAAQSPFRTSIGAGSSTGVNVTGSGTFALGKSAAQYQLNVNNSAVYDAINISGMGSKLTTVGNAGFNKATAADAGGIIQAGIAAYSTRAEQRLTATASTSPCL